MSQTHEGKKVTVSHDILRALNGNSAYYNGVIVTEDTLPTFVHLARTVHSITPYFHCTEKDLSKTNPHSHALFPLY